ncbi:hypothetical protein [Streptomyces shenzhenensis]|uniref:hypothetical protein n=1 Tax=Streptomyces shenzhenensis TaxID=943815 RepID=UPI0033C6AAAC
MTHERLGAVFRGDDGTVAGVADGLGAPEGLAVLGGELFVVERAQRRLPVIRLDAENLRWARAVRGWCARCA